MEDINKIQCFITFRQLGILESELMLKYMNVSWTQRVTFSVTLSNSLHCSQVQVPHLENEGVSLGEPYGTFQLQIARPLNKAQRQKQYHDLLSQVLKMFSLILAFMLFKVNGQRIQCAIKYL